MANSVETIASDIAALNEAERWLDKAVRCLDENRISHYLPRQHIRNALIALEEERQILQGWKR